MFSWTYDLNVDEKNPFGLFGFREDSFDSNCTVQPAQYPFVDLAEPSLAKSSILCKAFVAKYEFLTREFHCERSYLCINGVCYAVGMLSAQEIFFPLLKK